MYRPAASHVKRLHTLDHQQGAEYTHRVDVNTNSPLGSHSGSMSAVPAPKVICRTLRSVRFMRYRWKSSSPSWLVRRIANATVRPSKETQGSRITPPGQSCNTSVDTVPSALTLILQSCAPIR